MLADVTNGTMRVLQVTWADPIETLQRVAGMSREQLIAGFTSGDVPKPPIGELLGIDVLEVEQGRAVLVLRPDESHCNPLGLVAGGVAATVMDAAMWIALQLSLPDGSFAVTTGLNLHFVGQLAPSAGEARAEARAVHVGGSTGTAESRLVGADGVLYAHATASFSCYKGAPARPATG